MTGGVTLRLSSTVARLLKEETSCNERLAAVRGLTPLAPADFVSLLFILRSRGNEEEKAAVHKALAEITDDVLLAFLAEPDIHPRLLESLAHRYAARPEVAAILVAHPRIEAQTKDFLLENTSAAEFLPALDATAIEPDGEGGGEEVPVPPADDGEEVADEEFYSKYQLSQQMGIAEKIKMALTGDKEWRSILLKDANKLVSGSVIKNPRITDPEVLAICKSTVQNDEIVRVICANKEWVKNYEIRRALVYNHKTPLPMALRFLASLVEKDVGLIAKSKNISSVLSTQAKKILMTKKKM